MATNRDVNLIIRARDEASKAFDAASRAIESLTNMNASAGSSATAAGSKFEQMASTILTLDKAVAAFTGKFDTATQGLARQAAQISEYQSRLAGVKGQLDGAAQAADRLRVAIVETTLNGGDTAPLVAKLQVVQSEMKSLASESTKLERTLSGAQSGYNQGAAALAEYEQNLRGIGSASTFAKQEAEQVATALQRQARAAEQASAVLRTVEQSTGVARDRGDYDQLVTQLKKQSEEYEKLAIAERNAAEAAMQLAAIQRGTDSTGGKSARESASVFQADFAERERKLAEAVAERAKAQKDAEKATEAEAAAIQRLKDQVDPLAAIERKLTAETDKLNDMFRRGKIDADLHAKALKLLRAEADEAARKLGTSGIDSKGRPSLFGLTPNELTNFGYQINDVVTQLASGTSLTQTLAQQGGQIIQIFPRVGSAIAAAFTSGPVIALVATLGTLILAFKTAADESERLRTIEGVLTASADGAAHNAQQIGEAAKALDRYGMSAEEAVAAVRTFMREGVDDSRLVQFGTAAKNLADVMGGDLKQAQTDVADAFTGGYDAVKKLDDAYNFLTATQRSQIQALFEQGRAVDAQNMAIDIFSQKMDGAATKMRGPWSEAARTLSNAWADFLSTIADTGPIQDTGRALSILGLRISNVLDRLKGIRNASTILREIEANNKTIENLQGGVDIFGIGARRIAALKKENEELGKELDKIQAADNASAATVAQQVELRKKQSEDLKEATVAAAENKTLAEAETEARRKATKFLEENFKFASEETKQAYLRQEVEKATTQWKEKQAAAAKREADERKRAADEARRAAVQGIQDNGREGLIATAKRFDGFSENNASQRSALMEFFKSQNITVDPKMVAWCAAFVNAVLGANGLPGTGALNARSFLNYGQDATSNPQVGDIVVLRRGNNDAQGHVGFFQGFDGNGNVRVLGGNQGDAVGTQTFNSNDVLGIRRAPSTGQVAQEQQRELDALQKRQTAYNVSLDNALERRRLDTQQLRDQLGLQGEALLAKQREAAIEDAITKARQDAQKAGVDTESEAFKQKIEELKQVEGAYFDAAHARDAYQAQVTAVETPMRDLLNLRQELQQRMQALRDSGQGSAADALQPQLDDVNVRLREAIQNVKELYAEFANNPEALAALGLTADKIAAIQANLDASAASTQTLGTFMGISLGTIAQQFASGAANAFDRFAQAVAEGKNVMGSLRDAFLQFAADFLRQIAQMIIQQAIFNLVSGIFRSIGGGPSGIASAIGGSVGNGLVANPRDPLNVGMWHTGGLVGPNAPGSKPASPAWFTNALRYHTGGIAGLKPNEVPAILQRGEEVLTASDPRHVANGGGGGAAPVVKVINAIDSGDMVKQGLESKVGEKAILNFIRDNAGAVQRALSS